MWVGGGHSARRGKLKSSSVSSFPLVGGICGSLIRSNDGGSPARFSPRTCAGFISLMLVASCLFEPVAPSRKRLRSGRADPCKCQRRAFSVKWRNSVAKPTLGYPPIQIAEKPPSTDKSTPFTKLASSEARNSATVANFLRTTHLSPRDQGFRTSPSSPCRVAGNPVCRPAPGLSTFTRIFLPFSSSSHVRANERKDLRALGKARFLRSPYRRTLTRQAK